MAKGKRVSLETLIREWPNAESTKQLADKLGIQPVTIYNKKKELAGLGIHLKPLGRSTTKEDASKLKALAESLSVLDDESETKKTKGKK